MKVAIILLDTTEVVFTVFQQNSPTAWIPVQRQAYDLTPLEKGQALEAAEIIEVIANITFSQIPEHISSWKICARGIFEPLLLEVERATSMQTELLTLSREQELLCKGMVAEII